MTNTTITVTIGRNVGTTPLSPDRWHTFTTTTRLAVQAATTDLWSDATYQGGWDGVAEDAHLFYGPARSGAAVEVLRQRLAVLASRFGQDAIGLSVGTSELISALAHAAAERGAL